MCIRDRPLKAHGITARGDAYQDAVAEALEMVGLADDDLYNCLLYTSPSHENPEHHVCRLLPEKKKVPTTNHPSVSIAYIYT